MSCLVLSLLLEVWLTDLVRMWPVITTVEKKHNNNSEGSDVRSSSSVEPIDMAMAIALFNKNTGGIHPDNIAPTKYIGGNSTTDANRDGIDSCSNKRRRGRGTERHALEQFLETAQQRFDCYAHDTNVPMTVQFFGRAMQRVEHDLFSDWSQIAARSSLLVMLRAALCALMSTGERCRYNFNKD